MYKNVFRVFANCNTKVITCCAIAPKVFPPQLQSVRHLYDKQSLSLDGFVNARDKTRAQFTSQDVKFKGKMMEYTEADAKNMIFTEDLKNMIYLADATDEDVDLVMKMMKRFNRQNDQLRFGQFIFGPVVMRMFHNLNRPAEALKCFLDEELSGFFDQLSSYQILLDLLYENEMYDEVQTTFDKIKGQQIQGTKYPKNIVVITFAACYKQNTKESYEYAKNLWHELGQVGHLPMRRAVTFFAGLALRQNDPNVALEVITTTKNQNYVTVRNLKVAGLTAIGRLDDALPILKQSLNVDVPNEGRKQTFCVDIMESVRKTFSGQSDAALQQEFAKVDKYLMEQGHITNETLEDHLCSEIQIVQRQPRRDNTSPVYREYNGPQSYDRGDQRDRRQRDFTTYRPSLKDMQ